MDFANDPAKLGRALAEGFAFQGEVMQCTGRKRGEPSSHLSPLAFISFIQNHDQIGNRAFGERIDELATPSAIEALIAIYLLAPQVPMLFMGEEWASSRPFPYFCDFTGELAQKIREGRQKEFASFPEFQDPEKLKRIPDPNALATFHSSKLDWENLTASPHDARLSLYKRLLEIRRIHIAPLLEFIKPNSSCFELIAATGIYVKWALQDGSSLTLLTNLSDSTIQTVAPLHGETVWQQGPEALAGQLGPWSVRWARHYR